jgi:AcrR family transcriptional regulator
MYSRLTERPFCHRVHKMEKLPKDMKQKIKAIAVQLIYQKGYHACSISNIADRVGIQKSSIYYHYLNKEELLYGILKDTMEDLIESLERSLQNIEGTEERLRALIRNHLNFHMDRQKEVIISDSEMRGLTADNLRSVIRMRDEYDRKTREVIKKGIDEGIFINKDTRVVVNAIITMCTQTSTWFNPLGDLSKEEVIDIYTKIIFDGLKVKK